MAELPNADGSINVRWNQDAPAPPPPKGPAVCPPASLNDGVLLEQRESSQVFLFGNIGSRFNTSIQADPDDLAGRTSAVRNLLPMVVVETEWER